MSLYYIQTEEGNEDAVPMWTVSYVLKCNVTIDVEVREFGVH